MKMKKYIFILGLMCSLLTACYGDYTMDYEYTGVYSAYQYDLRSFVIGEGAKFDFTVALAGIVNNDEDREIKVQIEDELVTGDLSEIYPEAGVAEFTALDGLKGQGKFGLLSQSYVSKAFAGVSEIRPLPSSYYIVEGIDDLVIRKGRHTAAVTIKATEEMFTDEKAFGAYYAIGFRILEAEADVVVKDRSFEIIGVKCENRFYGNWYHGGKTVIKNDSTGEIISTSEYELTVPQAESKLYTLTTLNANTVRTNKMEGREGYLLLEFNGNDISISCDDPSVILNPIQGYPSRFNDAPLLQDRRLSINYSFSNGDGTTTYVYDNLLFRNRIRDGINEWQDENTENYDK